MKKLALLSAGALVFLMGCSTDEVKIREIAQQEAQKAVEQYKATHVSAPAKFGFGVPWEKEFSYAEGNKVGDFIFVAGQLSHDRNLDEKGMPKTDMMTGKNFEEQYRQTLENIKAVLANYGATMDDVVFLQNFVDPEAGKMKAGDYNPVAAKLVREYFPNGLQAMTFVEVVNLYGPEQLVESNAIAYVGHK